MAGKPDAKLKMLAVLDILWYLTDEENILSANEICALLEEREIFAERKSIYADIDNLTKFGFDIVCTKFPKRGYFMASRSFEVAEVRLLLDAVMGAQFISNKKAQALKEKLFKLLSNSQAERIDRRLVPCNRLKCDNEELYYTIDTINSAIERGLKIEFKYIRRALTKRVSARTYERVFKVSPYGLVWTGDRYYLVSNNEKYDNLMHTRLDRMTKVKIIYDERIRPYSQITGKKEDFNPAAYAAVHLNMFSGEQADIELCCSTDILDEILDRFGNDVPLRAVENDRFIIKTQAAISKGLVAWLLQYSADIKVLSPQSLADEIVRNAGSILALYKTDDGVISE
ncbi:MAG: helix-turn-helix transcriptional regulator [Acutalibacteraceae bacterium]|jgi:predicted DNA-binding transcriptional regulator YafY